jgi:predicted oxidoreductase
MSVELDTQEINLSEVFLDILSKGDMHLLKEFLDEQNISDVVELVNEFPENEATIVDNMTVHRAVSVFKILDINQQKDIIKELPARKTAKILNDDGLIAVSNPGSITIPSHGASISSMLNVEGWGTSAIKSIEITLYGVSHTYPDDLDILLRIYFHYLYHARST